MTAIDQPPLTFVDFSFEEVLIKFGKTNKRNATVQSFANFLAKN